MSIVSRLNRPEYKIEVVCFWTGDTPMSEARKKCLDQMRPVIGLPIRLLTKDTIPGALHPDYPLHPAYPYLSETHKADYLRTYWMHIYGGGYSDIKYQTGSWVNALRKLHNSDAYITGYRELGPDGIACSDIAHEWSSLIGNGAYICKPNTPLTAAWFGRMNALLDEKLDALRKNPAKFAQDRAELGDGYPLEWNEMLGRIFHKVCYEFRDKIEYGVPIVKCWNYR